LSSVPARKTWWRATSIRLPRQFDPDARPRAVYAGKRVIGFLMYDVQKPKDKAQEASIYRFMIDRKHQGKGYGRAALSKALEEIPSDPGG